MALAQHFTKPVTRVRETSDLETVAQLMQREAIGCVVVVNEEGHATGIVTDRDLALRAVAWAEEPAVVSVASVMTCPVEGVEPGTSVVHVVDRMRSLGVRRLPVLMEGQPVGLLSLDDLLEAFATELFDLSETSRNEIRDAKRKVRLENARQDLQEGLDNLRGRLERASWRAQGSFLSELDEIRDRLAKALGR